MEDNELVKAYVRGEEVALESIIDKYAGRLFAFAYRLSGDRAMAEDAVQDAFVKVWKNLGKFDGKRSFRAWIFAITRNVTIDILRSRKDISFGSLDGDDEVSFSETIPDDLPLADIVFDQALEQKIVEEVLSELSVDSRAVVFLHDKEDLTFEEIGQALKEPLNTVKSRYRRAIIVLRDKVASKKMG